MSKLAPALVVLASAAIPASALAKAPVPAVATGNAQNVGFAQATLTGSVNPRGQLALYAFQYGTTSRYGQSTGALGVPAVNAKVNVSVPIGGLAPLTTYHFRLVASSAGGSSRGADRTFRTGPIPLALGIAAQPSTVIFGSPLQVAGTLTGTFSAGRNVVLQANPFPYTAGFANLANPELTNANGSYQFTVLGLGTTSQLRVVSIGKPTIVSPVIYAHVAVRVTARGRHRGGRLRVSGFVAPGGVGAPVAIQRLARHKWVTVAGTVTRAGTLGRARFTKLLKGRRRRHGLFRAYVRSTDGARDAGVSAPVRL